MNEKNNVFLLYSVNDFIDKYSSNPDPPELHGVFSNLYGLNLFFEYLNPGIGLTFNKNLNSIVLPYLTGDYPCKEEWYYETWEVKGDK